MLDMADIDSSCLTGTVNSSAIVDNMRKYEEDLPKNSLQKSEMSKVSATDVEMSAALNFLCTDIYVFSRIPGPNTRMARIKYSASCMGDEENRDYNAIYLDHSTGDRPLRVGVKSISSVRVNATLLNLDVFASENRHSHISLCPQCRISSICLTNIVISDLSNSHFQFRQIDKTIEISQCVV